MVAPGKYSVELYVLNNGQLQSQGTTQEFMVKAAPNVTLGVNYQEVAAFQRKGNELSRQMGSAGRKLGEASEKLRFMKAALLKTPGASQALFEQWESLNKDLANLQKGLNGDRIPSSFNEATSPSIRSRLGNAIGANAGTTQLPTATQKRDFGLAENGFNQFKSQAEAFYITLGAYEVALEKAGAPWTPGRKN